MNITKKLLGVFVVPESNGYQDVILRVLWVIEFEDAGFLSVGEIETFLPIDNLQNFIPANQVGNARLLQWVYNEQGGDAFFEQLKAFHTEQIYYQKIRAGTQRYSEGFDVPAAPADAITVDGAQTL